jgi:uncharacterized protein
MATGAHIVHEPEQKRFRHQSAGHSSYLSYRPLDERTVDFTSTWVAPALRGRGIGAHLTLRALEWAQAEGLRVVPSCWFVREVMERHPRFRSLIA